MITARELTKRYGSSTAVAGLSFEVLPGRVTGFLGPNGAGKSTTMRMIMGLDAPDAGEALIDGLPYAAMDQPLRRIGALLDADAIHGGRSAYDHLLAIAQSNEITRGRVAEVLALTGLASVARKRVGGFSLGMKQRLGIAAALLGDPGILMFDEPINGLDPEGVHWIRGLMQGFAAEGRTVFVSSHLMSEMAVTADHLIVVGKGRLIADVSMRDFVRSSTRSDVFVRTPQETELARLLSAAGAVVVPETEGGLAITGATLHEIGDLIAERHFTVYELTPRHPSLEEAFMELTEESVEFRADPDGPVDPPGGRTATAARAGAKVVRS
ncbi:ABC transporter ATP-binding protein [Embleya sp. AB8]|uniref:ABC transporter ATP-binding protein n=1 Tax=Embleya sp. AB8 TaxID=3156304 RepID=UPI003C722F26